MNAWITHSNCTAAVREKNTELKTTQQRPESRITFRKWQCEGDLGVSKNSPDNNEKGKERGGGKSNNRSMRYTYRNLKETQHQGREWQAKKGGLAAAMTWRIWSPGKECGLQDHTLWLTGGCGAFCIPSACTWISNSIYSQPIQTLGTQDYSSWVLSGSWAPSYKNQWK